MILWQKKINRRKSGLFLPYRRHKVGFARGSLRLDNGTIASPVPLSVLRRDLFPHLLLPPFSNTWCGKRGLVQLYLPCQTKANSSKLPQFINKSLMFTMASLRPLLLLNLRTFVCFGISLRFSLLCASILFLLSFLRLLRFSCSP